MRASIACSSSLGTTRSLTSPIVRAAHPSRKLRPPPELDRAVTHRSGVRRIRIAALTVALTAAAVTSLTGHSASPPPSTVACDKVVLTAESGRAGGRRIVFGAVSVPPAYLSQVVPTGRRPWAYASKAALLVRGGSPPVTVSVPRAWRSRVAIGWGQDGGSALRFARCPAYERQKPWNVYTGGFSLRAASACVPLTFRVGQRVATVRFGLGRPCPRF